ncbi:hypothetical protein GIB67_000244 [Kingdonia uniflora]|uniref:Uncharacterized protein n=1 Tax=Kingdonia uniflora TaxID=39325 RepID=A0A7J7LC05_9MAGN|nr:hypothetical protein GIB67_000244 [Kingdonia uniflora]
MASKLISHQIFCYSSVINRNSNLHLKKRSTVSIPFRSKISAGMHIEKNGTEFSTSETVTSSSHAANLLKSNTEEASKSYPSSEELVAEQPIRAAKIHDFCFGIPYGGIILSGGLMNFLISRNPTNLFTGLLCGGGLLALSTFSLKVWRQGKSSLPFVLGQAALSAVLLRKHFQNYALTKKIFPTGFSAVLSAAMLCFYSYVLVSGGNPPPKKLKLASSPPL